MMGKPAVVVIHIGAEKTSDEQLQSIFSIGPTTPWFKAMLEILDEHRHERAMTAANFAVQNNELGQSAALGGYEILTTVILDLIDRRRRAQ